MRPSTKLIQLFLTNRDLIAIVAPVRSKHYLAHGQIGKVFRRSSVQNLTLTLVLASGERLSLTRVTAAAEERLRASEIFIFLFSSTVCRYVNLLTRFPRGWGGHTMEDFDLHGGCP